MHDYLWFLPGAGLANLAAVRRDRIPQHDNPLTMPPSRKYVWLANNTVRAETGDPHSVRYHRALSYELTVSRQNTTERRHGWKNIPKSGNQWETCALTRLTNHERLPAVRRQVHKYPPLQVRYCNAFWNEKYVWPDKSDYQKVQNQMLKIKMGCG